MEAFHEVHQLLPSLPRGEKAQVLKWVVQDLGDDFPGIDSLPSVCGGDPCIVRTHSAAIDGQIQANEAA